VSKYRELKERVYECNQKLPLHGLVKYTFGNVSAVDRKAGVIAIKPSGVSYEEMTPQDMVIVDLDNNVVEGKMRPSSDTKTHIVLYRYFSQIGGVVHTHATYSVAWAQAGKPIPVLGTTHADHASQEIPCTHEMTKTQISGDYETETGNKIIETFGKISPSDVEMVLVAGHGPFTWGSTPEKAVYNAVVLEELAKMAMMTLSINPKTRGISSELIKKHYLRKHGKDAYYGQNSGGGNRK